MTVAEAEVSYPAHLEADVVLRTGRTLRVRPVRREDDERLRAFFKTLSPESCHARFFAMCTPDQALVHSPTHVDYIHDFGVVGEIGTRIVAGTCPAHPYVSARFSANVTLSAAEIGANAGRCTAASVRNGIARKK